MKNLQIYKCMKKIRQIIVLLLSISMSYAYANNNATISIERILEQNQYTILDVFKQIEAETGYVFLYSAEIEGELNKTAISKTVKGTIQEILNPLLDKTELT